MEKKIDGYRVIEVEPQPPPKARALRLEADTAIEAAAYYLDFKTCGEAGRIVIQPGPAVKRDSGRIGSFSVPREAILALAEDVKAGRI